MQLRSVCSGYYEATGKTPYAEHAGANLLPCNAATRLQARGQHPYTMSALAEFDCRLEQMIRAFALRILVPRWTDFDAVWETANGVCDRYQLGSRGPGQQPSDIPNA